MTTPPWAIEPEPSEDDDRPFVVLNDSMADWAMAKLASAEGELRAIRAQYEDWKERLEQWAESVSRKPEDTRLYMTALLGDYARRQREETGRATLKLPSGEVQTRSKPEHIEVTDPDALLAWLDDNGYAHAVRVSRDVDKRALTSALHIYDGKALLLGEIVPGVDVVPEDVSVTVKPS